MMTFIRYIGVDFRFELLDCVHYNEDFVISRFVILRFCSIHCKYCTCNFGGAEDPSLYRGLRFIEVR